MHIFVYMVVSNLCNHLIWYLIMSLYKILSNHYADFYHSPLTLAGVKGLHNVYRRRSQWYIGTVVLNKCHLWLLYEQRRLPRPQNVDGWLKQIIKWQMLRRQPLTAPEPKTQCWDKQGTFMDGGWVWQRHIGRSPLLADFQNHNSYLTNYLPYPRQRHEGKMCRESGMVKEKMGHKWDRHKGRKQDIFPLTHFHFVQVQHSPDRFCAIPFTGSASSSPFFNSTQCIFLEGGMNIKVTVTDVASVKCVEGVGLRFFKELFVIFGWLLPLQLIRSLCLCFLYGSSK